MTTEEKLRHFYEVSIESAKEEAADEPFPNTGILWKGNWKNIKKKKKAASENQFKIESESAAREINKALSSEHLHIKRRLSKKHQELEEKLFQEVEDMLKAFLSGPEYADWLEDKVKRALKNAEGDQVEIYLSSGDEGFWQKNWKNVLGIRPQISQDSFLGGDPGSDPGKKYFDRLYPSHCAGIGEGKL